jgi:glycosyltransferase involved in cell wall biosynthesis/predicted SAM-dependent methyltransferase
MRRSQRMEARLSKDFFFEKKKQKTFTPAVRARRNARANMQKFFGSFFQKRTSHLLTNHLLFEAIKAPKRATRCSMPRVSVFIPSYNHAPYVGAAIASIQAQSFQDFEIIVTDDGSSDGTADVLASINEPRLHLKRFASNRGAVAATNDAIGRCQGEYLALLNSDDVFLPHKLATQVAFLDAHPDIGAVFGLSQAIDHEGAPLDERVSFNARVFDVENRSQAEWLRFFFFHGNRICHPTIMIRRECYDAVGLYDARFATLPDFQMWIRLVSSYPIHILHEPLIGFRELPNNGNASSIGSVSAYVRLAWEHAHVRRCYLDVPAPLFAAAFAPEMAALAINPGDDRRLILGRICLSVDNPTLHRMGMELLFEGLPAEPWPADTQAGFGHADFLRETGARDVFNIAHELRIAELSTQLRELREQREHIAQPPPTPMAWNLPEDGPKLNLGCGKNILPGWINLDSDPRPGARAWHATQDLPCEAGSVSLIYAEHVIGHLALPDIMRLLRECHRVLRPLGILRLSTPDLQTLLDAYADGRRGEWRDVGWVPATLCDLLNEGMRSWGNQYVFDRPRLIECLQQAGFARIAPAPWRQSALPAMQNLERRPFHGDLIVEAQK